MKFQWFKNPAAKKILPGFKLKIKIGSTHLVLPVINCTESHTLCIVPHLIPSDFFSEASFIGTPLEAPISNQIAIIRKEFFFERLYWLIFYKQKMEYFSILELPQIDIFQQQPSHFLQMSPLLPHEIASLSFLEEQDVFVRLIHDSPGCINNLNEFISRETPAPFYDCQY